MKKILFIILFSIIILAPLSVSAAGIGDALGNLRTVNQTTGLEENISTSLGTVINTALAFLGTVFFGLMIYAGILWMTAMGEEEKVKKAKNIITAAIIGLAVTLSAYAITYFVTSKLTGAGSSGSPMSQSGNDGIQPPALPAATPKCCEYDCGVMCSNYKWQASGDCPPTFEGDDYAGVTNDETQADCEG